MKRFGLLILLILLASLFVTACGDAAVTPPDTELEPTLETDEGIFPRPTVTPDDPHSDESYPVPAVPTLDADYPAPEAMPTYDPYPVVEGYVWVVHPVGEQCEDGQFYESVNAAVSALEEADVEVQRGSTVSLNVCLACGCPTSEHYRLHIAAEDLSKAEELGWELFRDGEG
jgi:hypothetical protein